SACETSSVTCKIPLSRSIIASRRRGSIINSSPARSQAHMMQFLLNHTRKLIGVMFGYAGIYKLLYPGQATMALVAVDVPYGLSNAIVLVVTMIELYLAVLLTLQIDLKYAMAVSMAIMLGFTIYLWYLSMLANPPSCGCLGLT